MRHAAILLSVLALVAVALQAPAQDGARSGAAPRTGAGRLQVVDLREVTLREACRLLGDATGLNLVPSQAAGEKDVSLYLRDVDGRVAIDAMCRAHGLWHREDGELGVVRIGTTEEYRVDLQGAHEERTEFFSLLYPNSYDVGRAIETLFAGRVVLDVVDADTEIVRDITERLERFDLINSRTQGLGTSVLGGSNFGGSGLGGSGFNTGFNSFGGDEFGGSGIPGGVGTRSQTGYRDRSGDQLRALEDRVAGEGEAPQLDPDTIAALERAAATDAARQSRQELLDRLARLEVAPIQVAVSGRQNRIAVRTSDKDALEQIRAIVANLDVPTALVLLEVRVLTIDLLDGFNSFFEYQWHADEFAGSFTEGSIQPPPPSSLDLAGTGLRAGDLIFQYVDANFAMRLQALERENRVRAVSTPLLLTAHNEVSRLFVGKEVPLNRTFDGGAVVANEGGTTSVTGSTGVEFRPVGVTLLLTPSINADRTVTLRIVQESSDADSTATVLVPSGEGFEQTTVNIVSSQTVAGTVVAQSGKAMVFGGLIEEGKGSQVSKVPFLGDIPLLGILFRRELKADTRRETIVVVRPIVLSTPSEAEAASRALLRELGSPMERGEVLAPGEQDYGFQFHGVGEPEGTR